jgi:PIN domain nuclease of toxin-antitoxin system
MNHYVADTHALFWYLTNSPQLGAQASAAFDEADNDQAIIYLPSIVAAELYFLNKKLSGAINFNKEMAALFQAGQFVFVPFTASDSLDFDADSAAGEMHDRIIAGVARRMNVTLLTRDVQIANSGVVATVW